MTSNEDWIRLTKNLFPATRSVLLTGSSALDRAIAGDIDLIALTPDVPLGDVEEFDFDSENGGVSVVGFNDNFFLAAVSRPDLTFYFIRELRKILFGRLLFDDGIGAASQRLVRRSSISRGEWLGLRERAVEKLSLVLATHCRGIMLFELIELLIVLRMNRKIDIRFSKHKYLLDDAEYAGERSLCELLSVVSRDLSENPSWPGMLFDADKLVSSEDLPKRILLSGPLKDAKVLAERGMLCESVIPYRFSLVKLHIAMLDGVQFRKPEAIRQLVESGLRYSGCVSDNLRRLLISCSVDDFQIRH